jgi:hypothetical protein
MTYFRVARYIFEKRSTTQGLSKPSLDYIGFSGEHFQIFFLSKSAIFAYFGQKSAKCIRFHQNLKYRCHTLYLNAATNILFIFKLIWRENVTLWGSV